jgi:hypothetical protein
MFLGSFLRFSEVLVNSVWAYDNTNKEISLFLNISLKKRALKIRLPRDKTRNWRTNENTNGVGLHLTLPATNINYYKQVEPCVRTNNRTTTWRADWSITWSWLVNYLCIRIAQREPVLVPGKKPSFAFPNHQHREASTCAVHEETWSWRHTCGAEGQNGNFLFLASILFCVWIHTVMGCKNQRCKHRPVINVTCQ